MTCIELRALETASRSVPKMADALWRIADAMETIASLMGAAVCGSEADGSAAAEAASSEDRTGEAADG